MPWTLKFWWTSSSPSVTWNYGSQPAPIDMPSQQALDFTSHLNSIASISTSAATRLNNFGQDIRVGYRQNDPGSAFAGSFDDYVLIDLNTAINVHFFNTQGKLVQGDIRLTIMHELAHIYLLQSDPSPASEATMNGAAFDFRGPVVDEQNAIATNANLVNQIQTAYDAGMLSTNTALFNLFSVNSSYSQDHEINITRLGTSGADNMDHSSRTQASVPNMIDDLLFGLGGNDTLKGGDGVDFLYGGGDPSVSGSGKDKLYGGDNGDWLYGGDDNDFLDCGLNSAEPEEQEETLDGGDGNDILIMRGTRTVATGGAGNDQFWIDDTADGSTYLINDSESGDSLYWNGYQLTGGSKQVIELIHHPTDVDQHYADVGALDSKGFRYYLSDGTLNIAAPDGSGIIIYGFSNGDLGINVGAAVTGTEVTWEWEEVQQGVWEWDYDTSLSLSSIANNSQAYDYASLPGYSSTLSGDGPNAIPTTWLP